LQTSPTPNPKNKDLTKVIPVIFIILGLALLGVSVFFLLKEKISLQKQEGI